MSSSSGHVPGQSAQPRHRPPATVPRDPALAAAWSSPGPRSTPVRGPQPRRSTPDVTAPGGTSPSAAGVTDSARPGPRGRPAPEVLTLVRASLQAVQDRPVYFAERFYRMLFERAPQLRTLFPPDLNAQRERLAGALRAAMDTATRADPEALIEFEDVLGRMGARHATRYRVRAEYYPFIGDALVQAARDVAGVVWSTRTSSAWVAVYEWLAGHMIRGALTAGDTSPIPVSLHRAVTAAATPRVAPTAPEQTAPPHSVVDSRGTGVHEATRPLPVLPPDDPGHATPLSDSRPETFPSADLPPLDAPEISPWAASQEPSSPLAMLIAAGAQR